MAKGYRSPFGELVRRHRLRLGLSQRTLANRTFDLAATGRDFSAVSERTIQALEREYADGHAPRSPRLSTVRTLARVFGLSPGTDAYDEFLEAATGESDTDVAGPGGPDPSTVEAAGFLPEGREPHLAHLQEAIDAAANGTAGAIFVGADPGTGKSSLIEEACRQALARHPEMVVLWTECTGGFGAGPSCQPFRKMLGLMVGDLAAASERELVSERNAAGITGRVPAAARAVATAVPELIDTLLPVGMLDNDTISRILDDAIRHQLDRAIQQRLASAHRGTEPGEPIFRMLSRYAEEGPVVLVLEDLHWADTGTLSVLAHLLSRLTHRRLPVLLLGSYRPGETGAGDDTAQPTLQTVLDATPRLFPDAMLDLSTAVGGDAGRTFVDAVVSQAGLPESADLAAFIFQRTAGLPLFVVSILRLCGQRLSGDGLLDIPLPTEVRMVFAEQVQHLDTRVRKLLVAASVQGNEFAAEPLMRMFDLAPDEFIDMADSRLVRQFHMLRPGRTVTIAGSTVHHYEFSHALLRDYLASAMSTFQQEHYHAATAEAMVAIYGWGDHDGMERIAFHFHEAGRWREAAEAFLRAGDHAMGSRDFDRAIAHYLRLEELGARLSEPELSLHGLIGQGNVSRSMGDADQARALLDRAYELAGRHELPVVQAHVMESIAMLDFDAGDMEAGIERLTAVVEARLEANHWGTARSMTNLSYLLYGVGRYEDALSYARQAAVIASEHKEDLRWASAMLAIGNCWLDLGLYDRAIETYEKCLEACERTGATHLQRLCLLNIALAHTETGRWDEATDAIDRAGVTVDDRAIRLVGMSEFGKGLVAEGRNDLDAAREHYHRSRELRELGSQEALVIDALAGLLRVAIRTGETDEATSLLADIERRIASRGTVGVEHLGRLLVTRVEAHRALGDHEQAEDALREAVRALGERAGWICDPERREFFLTCVPAHCRIVEMASAAGIDLDV